MWRFFIAREKKYVYIHVIYPKLHLRLPSDLGWSGVETRDFVRWSHRTWFLQFYLCCTHVFLCWSTTSRRSEHAPSVDKFSSHRCRSYRTGEGWCLVMLKKIVNRRRRRTVVFFHRCLTLNVLTVLNLKVYIFYILMLGVYYLKLKNFA